MKVWNWKDLVHCKILALQYTNFISAQGIWHFFFLWKYTWERFLQIWRLTIDKYEFSQLVCFKVKVRSNLHSKDQDITSPNCLPYITNNSDSEKLMLNRKHPLNWCFFFLYLNILLNKVFILKVEGRTNMWLQVPCGSESIDKGEILVNHKQHKIQHSNKDTLEKSKYLNWHSTCTGCDIF